MRIGYLVPEFPGQTHTFFWRELAALRDLGVEADVVSTRKPHAKLVSHTWAGEAMIRTTYLSPARPGDLFGAVVEMIGSGPRAWRRALGAITGADTGSFKQRMRLLALALIGARVARLARGRGWTHLHAHSCADAAHVAMFARLLSGLKYSLTLHGPLGDYGPNQRNKWRHAAFGLVITKRLEDEVRHVLGDAIRRVEIAPMGVALDNAIRSKPYAPWAGEGPCRVFSCGRLNPCKGHDYLIQAIATLRDRGLDARLDIAGEADSANDFYRRRLEEIIDRLGLQGYVRLLGAVSETHVRSGLDSAHVFALASLEEPLGVAIMEAMAMRTPVVTTRAGGVPELVDDGEDGLLVPPRDPIETAVAIERLLRDPGLSVRIAEAGRLKIERSFHSGISAGVLVRCIRDAQITRPDERIA